MNTTRDEQPPLAQLGRYRLLEKLGAGGMGEVHRGHDPLLDRDVAVKLPFFHGPPEQVARLAQRFQREARAAAQLHHPHVCPVYDVGEQDGQPFVVMAFLPGPSLAQRLAAGRFKDVGEAVKILLQLLDGLAEVHALGVVHRDLKPGNVLFDAAGRAVLTDFGLARPDGDTPLTSANAVLGTPAYMAPEQAAGQLDHLGPWTDLYSLGVVLYQMVTGRLPFEGPAAAVLPRIVAEAPPPPSRFRPDLDPAVEAAILKALRKEPIDRFHNAGEFAAALAGRFPAAPADAGPPTLAESVSTTPPGIPRWTPFRILGWFAGDLLVALPAGLVALLVIVWVSDKGGGKDIAALGVLIITALAWGLGALGVAVWGWVESLYVPEGLLYFARRGLVGWARRALANGVPPDARNDLGETPLLLAATNGQTEMVKLLLLNGASPAVPDRLGQTPLDAARAKGYADIAGLLARHAGSADAVPPRPLPRPRVWSRLLADVVVGAALVVLACYWSADRSPITPEEFLGLAEARQISEVVISGNLVRGEVKDPAHPAVRPLRLRGRKFWAPLSPAIPRENLRGILEAGVKTSVVSGAGMADDIWPGFWLAVAMAAWPVVVLGLGLKVLPLWAAGDEFPFLALRGRGRRA